MVAILQSIEDTLWPGEAETTAKQPQLVVIPNGWVSTKVAAKRLDILPGVVRKLIDDGKLEVSYIGESVFVSKDSILFYEKTRGPKQGGRPKKKSGNIGLSTI